MKLLTYILQYAIFKIQNNISQQQRRLQDGKYSLCESFNSRAK